MNAHEQEAYDTGVQAAKNAASWIIDGNTSEDHVRRVLAMLDDGDPMVDQYLPNTPNLSGEWADDPTPLSLARDIIGDEDLLDADAPELIEEIANAFDAGVTDTFLPECERILRAALA
jgi:hypothetical protein